MRTRVRFSFRGPPGTDDPNEVVCALRPHDQHEPAPNGPDRLETVFGVAMGDVIDLQNRRVCGEEFACLLERYTVHTFISRCLVRIPLKLLA